MRNYRLLDFRQELIAIVGSEKVITEQSKIRFYSTGIRVGFGDACAVVFPKDLIQLWKILETAISFDKIILLQAANTGLTGGSTPDGNNYDRDVVIINTLHLDKLFILNNGSQVIALPGTTLFQLEEQLLPLGRGPHSVIGSSCIGASVVGGVCNNSGGNLVNRGPAYTELSLFARLNQKGQLELVNHLDIELGDSPEKILTNLESANFKKKGLQDSDRMASDRTYQKRVRDFHAITPSRFNADKRRHYEASGCAGKIAVFAVRLDTFPLPKDEQVFLVGTNNPRRFTELREKILLTFDHLPDMGEYMHRSYFDGSDKYCKDTFLIIKYFGTRFLPKLLAIKRKLDYIAVKTRFLPKHFSDKVLQFIANIFPDHLPERIRDIRRKYEHYMVLLTSDKSIEPTQNLLDLAISLEDDYDYIKCTSSEGKDLLLHRYVAGAAPVRYRIINSSKVGELLPLDVALPRNCTSWYQILPREIISQMAESFQMGHFLCMVFHWDFVLKKGANLNDLKEQILTILDKNNAKYPAEHNVGHLYKADECLESFYRSLDPTNSFNPGIGKTSKKKHYE
ncbi:D-lactate dehydrogenase [Prochlorococcus sp. MIT 1307]|uniref:D-lactate dehydrogenase n=1 Tax=Prochlorococcus sp. MIT 1307 TaxID=3096219 RepID=UPI002A7498F8|nr:D-lactate dehydrogenase [Prochlorococcus sp. MIT 1307]